MAKGLWLKIFGVWAALMFSALLWTRAAAPAAWAHETPAKDAIVIKALPAE